MSHLDSSRFPEYVTHLASRLELRHEHSVLLGMGGSSSGGGMFAEHLAASQLDILDTSYPDDVQGCTFEGTNVIVSSKSGSTIETLSALAWALEHGLAPRDLIVVTDPGTSLETLGRSLGAMVIHGDPATGGRYSAFSAFGLVPALAAGWSLESLLGLPLPSVASARDAFIEGFTHARAWDSGDILTYRLSGDPLTSFTSLWEEQLVAESTGKSGVGVVPVVGCSPIASDTLLVHAWSRHWWTVGASTGLGVDPFNQPDVESAKVGVRPRLERRGPAVWPQSTERLDLDAAPYVALQVFGSLSLAAQVGQVRDRWARAGKLVTASIGPRYLHSTGQLHKGGPRGVVAVQVVVTPTSAPAMVPGQSFSFHDLCMAQAQADAQALIDAGQHVIHVQVEDLDQLDDLEALL
jgi:hypothetical protein